MNRLFICTKVGMLKPYIYQMFDGTNTYYAFDRDYDPQQSGKALYRHMHTENIQEVYMVDLRYGQASALIRPVEDNAP